MEGVAQIEKLEFKVLIALIIGFIFTLTVVILIGRVLDDINKSSSSSKSDTHIQNAHRWAQWGVGISAALAGLLLIGIFVMLGLMFL